MYWHGWQPSGILDCFTVRCGSVLGVQQLQSQQQLKHQKTRHGAPRSEDNRIEHDRRDVRHPNAVGREYGQDSGVVRPERQGHRGLGSIPPHRRVIPHENADG